MEIEEVYPEATPEQLAEAKQALDDYIQVVLDVAGHLRAQSVDEDQTDA